MKRSFSQYGVFFLLAASLLAVFIGRTALAARGSVPRFNDLFTAVTLVGSGAVWIAGRRSLHRSDWVIAAGTGAFVGVTMAFTTLFSPYPIFEIFDGKFVQAAARGLASTLAMLGGLVIMRQGGPVQVLAARKLAAQKPAATAGRRGLGRSTLVGLATGAPLAVVNVFALQFSAGRPVAWQNPLAALLDALQPAVVEEVIYRFAMLGLFWLALRRSLPRQAPLLAGLLALLVHNFMHYDDLFLQAPLAALGMGLAMAVLWGLPLTYLALRRGLEAAVAFHWIQDAARFLAGF